MSFQKDLTKIIGVDFFKGDWTKHLTTAKFHNGPQDVQHSIELPLEKLYTGTEIRIRADKKMPCKSCNKGILGQLCTICGGPNASCHKKPPACSFCIRGYKKCMVCTGNGFSNSEKHFNVSVKAGSRDGQIIRLYGQGDTLVNDQTRSSDIVCRINEIPHKEFKRSFNDLYVKRTITLNQALCGFKLKLRHLDNRRIVLCVPPGKVIKTGDMRLAKNEGMPIQKKAGEKGDLIVVFNVVFPSKIQKSNLNEIKSLFPKPPNYNIDLSDKEEYDLVNFDPKEQVYHVPFRQQEAYMENSPMKPKMKEEKCAQQ